MAETEQQVDLDALVNPAAILQEYRAVLAELGCLEVDAEPATKLDALRALERHMGLASVQELRAKLVRLCPEVR